MTIPAVFVDTCVFKFAATSLPRVIPRAKSLDWGNRSFEVTVHDPVTVNPNDAIANDELRAEAELLPRLAELGRVGAVRYLMSVEVLEESLGMPNMDSESGTFYDAPYEIVSAPLKYSRMMSGSKKKREEHKFNFLASIKHPRFVQLQKVTGAYQGKLKQSHNQLVDAFHLWCAEHHSCPYFLTLDFKLIKVVGLSPTKSQVSLLRPSELLSRIKVPAN